MEILSNLTELTDERLVEYLAELRTAFAALLEAEAPSADQVAEGEALADAIEACAGEQDGRVTAAADIAARADALRVRFAADPDDPDEDPDEDPADPDAPADPPVEPAQAAAKPAPKAKPATAAQIAARIDRPVVPLQTRRPITITAAADVPGWATSADMADMAAVAEATIAKMGGFLPPAGDGETEDFRHFPVASFKLDIPDEFMMDEHDADKAMRQIREAADERRLPGGSLTESRRLAELEYVGTSRTASGGWCSPSEQLYDLCSAETTEGILSVPEVGVKRGGFKFTKGPDFATIYAAVGFLQTEAQAIAGTTKAAFEITCPTWTDVRLDAVGLYIKAPILTNAAYPELVQRWLSGAMIAHQHKVNASVISRIVTAAGAARVVTGLGSVMTDTLEGLALIADGRREAWRMSLTHTMEVFVPFWLKEAYRSDIGRRQGREAAAVTDAEINSHFAVRHLNVQYVYDWNPLTLTPEVYPATYQAVMYPAGTFVKGTSDIISLNAIYDNASLAVNVYTALFFEEGLLVANTCFDADLVTLPICTAGRTGAANLTCS